jgi:hypothetical protein
VLVELSVMEPRYQAVLAVVQDGWRVVEVARRGRLPPDRPRLDRSLRGGLGRHTIRLRGVLNPPSGSGGRFPGGALPRGQVPPWPTAS